MSDYVSPDPFIPLDRVRNSTLFGTGLDSFTKIYCSCGRIVDIDTKAYRRKLALHKPVECAFCRNERISDEIDHLDAHYNFIEEPEEL